MPYNRTGSVRQVHPGCQFWVELDGDETAAFTECRGLQFEVKTESIEEGGVNDYVHERPIRVTYGHIVLKQGIGDSTKLWDWYKTVLIGQPQRKRLTITLYDSKNSPVQRWSFKGAFPIKWTGPELKADSRAAAVQQLEIAHEGLILE